jgi:hypothetical protein
MATDKSVRQSNFVVMHLVTLLLIARNLTTLLLIFINKQTGLGLDVRGLTPSNSRFFFLLFSRWRLASLLSYRYRKLLSLRVKFTIAGNCPHMDQKSIWDGKRIQ